MTLGEYSPINISANHGSVYVVDAIKMAVENARMRNLRHYRSAYKPWIILFIDGWCHDDHNYLLSVAAYVREKQKEEKLFVLCLSMGDSEPIQFKALFDYVFVIKEYAFNEFFSWLGKAIQSVYRHSPKQKVMLPLLHSIKELEDEIIYKV